MTNENPRGLPVAWKAEWHDWTQYHDETDPLPEKWDDAPLNVTPLVLATDYAALLAEVEALRDMNRRQALRVMEQESARIYAEARAERLAKAGRRVTAAFRAHGEATPYTGNEDRTRHECESAMLALDAALEQEGKRDE